MKTLGDLVHYVLDYRRGPAFRGYTEHEVASALLYFTEHHVMWYIVDTNDKLVGIILATKYPDEHRLFVNETLTTEKGVFKLFINRYRNEFHGWKIDGQRWKGPERTIPRQVHYNIRKLEALV